MKTLHKRCAGLDVHKKEVVACLRVVARSKATYEVRRFPTTTRDLIALAEWLEAAQCTHVAMEATGVYWKPVWHILEGRFQLILANAAHIKGVPGRKSDVNDATWIADLLAHGLIRASFVPPQPIQELRDLTRTRKQLTREIVQHTQRIQAVLEEANVKLSSAITDILGASGRRILKAIVGGETDPDKLSTLGSPRLSASRSELSDALHGRIREHHRFLIDQHLKTIEQLEATIVAFDARIEAALAPFRDCVDRLKEIPGLSETSAQILLAEIGADMSQFPTAGHLLSWAGLVPRLDESAGRRRSTRVKKVLLAEARSRAMRLGSRTQQEQLLPGTVPAAEGPARGQEGSDRRRGVHPHHRLSHTGRRRLLPGPRPRALRAPPSGPHRTKACRPNSQPRLPSRHQGRRMTQPSSVSR